MPRSGNRAIRELTNQKGASSLWRRSSPQTGKSLYASSGVDVIPSSVVDRMETVDCRIGHCFGTINVVSSNSERVAHCSRLGICLWMDHVKEALRKRSEYKLEGRSVGSHWRPISTVASGDPIPILEDSTTALVLSFCEGGSLNILMKQKLGLQDSMCRASQADDRFAA